LSQLLITKIAPGVAQVTPTDPFSSFEIYRIDRDSWNETPQKPGIYLLYGFLDGAPAVYIGMSTTNMRNRIRTHHVTPKKDWFGVLFAIPIASTILIQALEAELIRRVEEADVVGVVTNQTPEARFLDTNDVHLAPALDGIIDGLQMLLGNDIFMPQDEEPGGTVGPIKRTPPLARIYRGTAEKIAPRSDDDPSEATHRFTVKATPAWGRFEAPEPDPRFRVLAGSSWREAVLDPSHAVFKQQQRVSNAQKTLVEQGVFDEAEHRLTRDHVFENWTRAAHLVSGVGSYSGGYHWQRLEENE
jgi:hypothetical protein